MIARGHMFFYAGQDTTCTPWIQNRTPFDTYSMMVDNYSRRQLTHQTDAPLAFLGVIGILQDDLGSDFIHCLPQSEIHAALLWSPIGSSIRRTHPDTGAFLFPSWSWLGWTGHAAYPWAMERDTFLSTTNSPLVWNNASDCDAEWFTFEDLCLPLSGSQSKLLGILTEKTQDNLGARAKANEFRRKPQCANGPLVQWPDHFPPQLEFTSAPTSYRLVFSTLVCRLYLCEEPYQRPKNYNARHPVWRMSVYDAMGVLAGYIDVPHPSTRKISLRAYDFAVMSRSTVDGVRQPAPDTLENRRIGRMLDQSGRASGGFHQIGGPGMPGGPTVGYVISEYIQPETPTEFVVAKGNFDRRTYHEKRPWCMFDVLMLEWVGEVAYRVAAGRVHVDAVVGHCECEQKVINLE
jgi:hypothetical protein